MTFLTFGTANLLYCNTFGTINLAAFQILVVFLVNAVKLIARGAVRIKVHLGLPVAIHAPSHAQLAYLLHFVHRRSPSLIASVG